MDRSARTMRAGSFLISIGLGAVGGWLAHVAGLPMPWLLGSILANAVWVVALPGRLNSPVAYPQPLRRIFIVVIAVMIGGTFTPALIETLPRWWPSYLAIVLYTIIAQAAAFQVFHRIAGYDRPTAWFAASPGGLIENVMLGEEAGGDAQIIALLHFVRLTLVVTIVPIGFTWWVGHSVGSAAGTSFATNTPALEIIDWALLTAAGVIGFGLGRLLRLPASPVVGPVLISGALHISGITEGQLPGWMGVLAQVFVGTGIGVQFAGLRGPVIVRALALCLTTVSLLLALALIAASLLEPITDVPVEVYLISFAPAGVIEMSLIALTLGANPVFVTTHHVLRVFVTVGITPQIYRLFIARASSVK